MIGDSSTTIAKRKEKTIGEMQGEAICWFIWVFSLLRRYHSRSYFLFMVCIAIASTPSQVNRRNEASKYLAKVKEIAGDDYAAFKALLHGYKAGGDKSQECVFFIMHIIALHLSNI